MSDIKSSIVKITNTITKTSGELIKSTKLSVNLASEEESLKALYLEIGKKVHEIYAYGGSLGSFFDEKYKEILGQETKIKDLRAQLDIAKGSKTCPGCGRSIDRGAEFCPKCGYKMSGEVISEKQVVAKEEDIPPISSQPPPSLTPVSNTVTCRVCGKENDASTKFCFSCGRML